MDRYNICKFPLNIAETPLKATAFVWEKNEDTIELKKNIIKNHVFLITSGSGTFIFNNKEYALQLGDLIFGFNGENYNCVNFSNLEYAYLKFEGSRSNDLFERFSITKENRVFSKLDFLIPFWKESLFNANENNMDLVAESILLYTFSKLKSEKKDEHPLIKEILSATTENLSNPRFNLKTLAKQLNYNEKYLSHLFKNHTKVGFIEYLRSLRIKNAVSLFDMGLNSVKNVALLSGFDDPLYFSTIFKKEMGVSPKQYINKE